VALGDGDVPLTPDDIRELTAAAAGDLSDPQLARAIELVASEAIAGR
jgi:hypothetical protein